MRDAQTANAPLGRGGTAVTAITEGVEGLIAEVGRLQHQILTTLSKQDERMAMLSKSTSLTRPALGASDLAGAPHRKAMDLYLRNGDDDGLRGIELDGKAMSGAINADGGYLIDPQTADRIMGVLRNSSSLRAVANIVNVDASSYDVLVDHGDIGAGWASETGAASETDTPSIERISIALHELSAMPKSSQRLLDDAAFDIETWLADRIADKFARAEAQAFINGDGLDKPFGILSHPAVAEQDWEWGGIGYVVTGAAGDFDAAQPSDAIVDLVYALGARYRANGSFLMNSKTAGAVRKMKDADGRFLWSDGLAAEQPARLMGYPVLICEDMPDIATDATAIAFGDFRAGYTIAERPDLRVLRDPFSAKPHVLFYATKRVGGDVSDFAAIKLLKFGVA